LINAPQPDLLRRTVTHNGCSNTDSRWCETEPGPGLLMSSWTSVAAMAIISSPLDLK
jgi:hypothetical protein